MTDQTPRLGLPWLMPAQAQKHVTVNEALRRLDALVQPCVRSRQIRQQPAVADVSEAYILPEDPQGDVWGGCAPGTLVIYQDGHWTQIVPFQGLQIFVSDETRSVIFDGEQWRALQPEPTRLDNLQALGIQASSDDHNRLAVRTNGAYLTAQETQSGGSGDLRLTLNKQGESQVASIMFQ